MANYRTIARPYAKALFEQALQDDQLQSWSQCLAILEVIQQDARVVHFINDPATKAQDGVDLFVDIVHSLMSLNETLADQLRNFVQLLTYNKRQYALPDITALYHQYLSEHEGVVQISVESAYPMAEVQQQRIKDALEKRFNSKVSIEYHENEALIGGALIRAGNWVMDGSIKGKLGRLGEIIRTG